MESAAELIPKGLITALTYGPNGWLDEILAGLWLSLSLSGSVFILGNLFGLLAAVGLRKAGAAQAASYQVAAITIKAVPEILLLFLVFYGGALALNSGLDLLDARGAVKLSPFAAGLIALGTVCAFYSTENYLGAFRAVPTGQWQAANALALRPWQTLLKVIFPQVLANAWPGITNLWMVTVKSTALVSIIGLQDLIKTAQMAALNTRQPLTFYLIALCIYLVITWVSERAAEIIQSRCFAVWRLG